MTTIDITAGRLLDPTGRLTDADRAAEAVVTISGGIIDSVIDPTGDPARNPVAADRSSPDAVIDASGLIVAPGFMDLQINGGLGFDLLNEPAAMWELGAGLPRFGVTSFLPTIISSPPSRTQAAIDALGSRPAGHLGAEPLGLHFEGPMLSPDRPGAHPVQHLKAADRDVIAGWSPERGVVLVTIAPELDNAPAIIAELVGRGVIVSAGHSEATAEQAKAGFDAGITMVTHLFNAMSPFGHRSPNLVGATLADARISAGLIIDGVHLAPEVVAAVWNAKGPGGVVVVTDAVGAMGMGPGTYRFAGITTTADLDGVRTDDGVLAGSILTMDRAVRNLVSFTGCEPGRALLAATATPARIIGETTRGRIEPGATADLVLLDRDLEVQVTICRGRVVHVADGARHRIPISLLETT